jgi:hypothetical protein
MIAAMCRRVFIIIRILYGVCVCCWYVKDIYNVGEVQNALSRCCGLSETNPVRELKD